MFRIFSKFLLKKQIVALGKRSGIVMPIEYLSLGRKIADLKSREDAYNLIEEFYDHESFLVKRAILISIRFIGKDAVEKLLDKLLESTKDEIGWVRYDSIWALADSEINDNRIYEALKRVSGDFINMSKEELEKIETSDDNDYAKKMATEKLLEYNARTK